MLRTATGIAVPYRRLDGGRVDHAGAEVGQLRGLLVADPRQGAGGFRNQARVAGHDAGHIGPDDHFAGLQRGPEQGGGVVGTAAAQGGGDALHGGGDEALRHQQLARRRARLRPDPPGGLRLRHVGVHEVVVGGDQSTAVQQPGGDAALSRALRQQDRYGALAEAEDGVVAARRPLPQQHHPGDDGAQLVEQLPELRGGARVLGAVQQRVRGGEVLAGDPLHHRAGFLPFAAAGGMRHLLQVIGGVAHGGGHQDHALLQRTGGDLESPVQQLGGRQRGAAELHHPHAVSSSSSSIVSALSTAAAAAPRTRL